MTSGACNELMPDRTVTRRHQSIGITIQLSEFETPFAHLRFAQRLLCSRFTLSSELNPQNTDTDTQSTDQIQTHC